MSLLQDRKNDSHLQYKGQGKQETKTHKIHSGPILRTKGTNEDSGLVQDIPKLKSPIYWVGDFMSKTENTSKKHSLCNSKKTL